MGLFKKIRFAVLLGMFAVIGAGKAWLDHSLNWHLDQLFDNLNPLWQGQYQSANVSWLGDIQLNEVQLHQQDKLAITLKSLNIANAWQFVNPRFYQHKATILLNGLRLEQSDFSQSRQMLFQIIGYGAYHLDNNLLQSIGYLKSQGQAQLTYTQLEPQRLAFKLIFIDDKLGTWHLSLDAMPLNWQQFLNADFPWQTWDSHIHWQQATLNFEPGVLWLPLLDALAQQQKLSLNDLQTQLIEKMQHDLQPWLRQQDSNSIKTSLQSLIQQGQGITLTLNPEQALSLKGLYQLPLEQWAGRLRAQLHTKNQQ